MTFLCICLSNCIKCVFLSLQLFTDCGEIDCGGVYGFKDNDKSVRGRICTFIRPPEEKKCL